MINVIWKPQPRQQIFQQRPEYEALYGGAAGGGKSDALLAEALRQVHIKHYKAIIFRKTFRQLEELIDRSKDIYGAAFPKARYNEGKHFWKFPSGAKIYFGNMQHIRDKTNYQGKRYDFIGFDELTHFTWEEYSYMYSRNRPSGPGTRVYIRSTTNPGGIGHGWVKERFITPVKPGTTMLYMAKVRQPDGIIKEIPRTRVFIPSSVFDNQILLNNDPNYLASLDMLPEKDKNALLYGDWDSFSGQVFTEFRNNADGYATHINSHVVDPFIVPSNWKIYRALDWGYSKPFSVGWYAVNADGCIYRIAEWYGCTKDPNTGIKLDPHEVAKKIKEIESQEENLKGKSIFGIADPAIYESSTGHSIAQMFAQSGVFFNRGDNKRIPGKMQCHYRLAFDEKGKAMFYVFSTCKQFIRTIPDLPYDDKHVEDIDTDAEDHIYDEWRYMCMINPIAARKNHTKREIEKLQDDPLDLMKKEQKKFKLYGM